MRPKARDTRATASTRLAGLSLIEALVAMAVLTILIIAVLPSFTNNARVNNSSELRTGAVAAAQQTLDQLRGQWGSWPASMTIDSGIRTYDVTITVCAAGSPDCFTTTDANHVRLEVDYQGETYYEIETVFARFE